MFQKVDKVGVFVKNKTKGGRKMLRKVAYVSVSLVLLVMACGGRKIHEYKDCTPDWYLKPPTDPNYLYAVTVAESQDLQLAIDKAKQDARLDLATQIESQVMGLIKKFDEEVGRGENTELLQQFTQVSKTVVDQTLVGVKVKE